MATISSILGNAASGSGINPVGGKFIPTQDHTFRDGELVTLRDDDFESITVTTMATVTLTPAEGNFVVNGYWKDQVGWTSISGVNNGGEVSNTHVFGGVKIIRLTVNDGTAQSGGTYTLRLTVEGYQVSTSLFRYIEVEGVGKLKLSNPIDDLGYNATSFQMPITAEQYTDIVASGTIKVKIPKSSWKDVSNVVFCPSSEVVTSLNLHYAGYYTPYLVKDDGGYNYDQKQRFYMGTLANPSNATDTILGLFASGNGASVPMGQSTDQFTLILENDLLPKHSFGSVNIKGIGNFPASACTTSDLHSKATIFNWNLPKFTLEINQKTGLDFIGKILEVDIDARAFVADRVYRFTQYVNGNVTTKLVQSAYSSWGASGSMSTKQVGNKNLFLMHFVNDPNHPWKVYVSIAVEGNSNGNTWMDYIEVKGVGRFYLKDHEAFYADTVNGADIYSWKLTASMWNTLVTEQNYDVQVFTSSSSRTLTVGNNGSINVDGGWKGYYNDGVNPKFGNLTNPAVGQHNILQLTPYRVNSSKFIVQFMLSDPNHVFDRKSIKSVAIAGLPTKNLSDSDVGFLRNDYGYLPHQPKLAHFHWPITQAQYESFPSSGNVTVVIN